MKYHIAAIGEVLFDVFPEGRRPGGAPANVAVIAAALGLKTALISAVGKDEAGDELLNELSVRGVNTDAVSRTDHPTGMVMVTVRNTIPSYEICLGVAWDNIPVNDTAAGIAADAGALVFGSLAQRSTVSRDTIMRLLKESSHPWKIFDINLRQDYYSLETVTESLHLADTLKISEEELPTVAKLLDLPAAPDAFAEAVAARYDLTEVLLTRGAEGCLIFHGAEQWSIPAYDAGPIADTVGAGDAFLAGYIRGRLAGMDRKEAGELASRTAGVVCTVTGAWAELPAID